MKTKRLLIAVSAFIIGTLLSCASASAQKVSGVKAKNNYRYDVEYVKSVGSGVDCVKIWSYTNKKKESVDLSKRNAVHAVIFKGYSGAGASKRALARDINAEQTYADFFNEFFAEGGEYGRFVANVGTRSLVKHGKDYKIGEEVTVNTAALRKYLEGHGVIKSMNSGF